MDIMKAYHLGARRLIRKMAPHSVAYHLTQFFKTLAFSENSFPKSMGGISAFRCLFNCKHYLIHSTCLLLGILNHLLHSASRKMYPRLITAPCEQNFSTSQFATSSSFLSHNAFTATFFPFFELSIAANTMARLLILS